MLWLSTFFGLAAAGCAGATGPAPPALFPADTLHVSEPAGNADASVPAALAREIADGQARHRATLARHGEWREDARYGSRWCPSQDASVDVNGRAFVPFRTGGHWVPSQAGAAWVADDPGSWQDVTTHAGWWVRHVGLDTWCWVPGTTPSAGRVAWRAGGGFVGWAPLGPMDAVDASAPAARAWTFTFLGGLHEDRLSVLEGDAAEVALANTMPLAREAPFLLVAPPPPMVEGARAELASHLVYHGYMARSAEPLPAAMHVWDALLYRPMQGAAAVAVHAGPAHIDPLVSTGGRFSSRRRGVLPLTPPGQSAFLHRRAPAPRVDPPPSWAAPGSAARVPASAAGQPGVQIE